VSANRRFGCRAFAAAAIALAGLGTLASAVAHDGEPGHRHAPPAAKPQEVYRPSLLPDRIILTWTGDPAVTQAVTWRSSTETPHGLAEIALATSGPEFANRSQRVEATSQTLQTDLGAAIYHTVEFVGLQPATKYAYRVGDGLNWSEWFQFTTASDRPEPFSFIYFGDAQNDLRSMWSRVVREAHADAPKARFMIHAGDLINKAEADAEWGEWFAAGGWLNGMIPSVPAPGNHEQAKQPDGTRRLSHHWRACFALPTHGPAGLEETCYTFTYQGVRIVALDSNRQQAEQAAWLDEVLTGNKARWVVCTFHHPIFSTGKDRDNAELRRLWKPVFDKHAVDLVLQGHDHTYGRTGLETPSSVALQPAPAAEGAAAPDAAEARPSAGSNAVPPATSNIPTGINRVDRRTGTVYVVSVSGPKMYSLQPDQLMVRKAEDTQLYQIVHVDGGQLRYEARTATGELYDAFTLTKRPGQINALTEQVPATPERLRPAAPKK